MSCPLCHAKAMATRQENSSRTIYNCKQCGMFLVSDLAEEELAARRHEVLSFIRSRKLAGSNGVVLISFEHAQPDRDYVQLTVPQIVDLYPKTFSEQLDKALVNLCHLSQYPGDEVRVESLDDAPWFYVRYDGFDALGFVIKALGQAGLVEVNYYGATFFPCGVVVSPAGWQHLDGLLETPDRRRRIFLVGGQSADERGQDLYKAAQQVARSEGMELTDSAGLDRGGLFEDALAAGVRRCDLLLCDLGAAGPETYYAAGFARALGKPVAVACHESEIGALGVDPLEAGVLAWKDRKQLQRRLQNYIDARM